VLPGLILGALATASVRLAGGAGIPALKKMGLLGIIGTVWILSSVAEEIFVRGWFQTWVARIRGEDGAAVRWLSASLFSAMHLTLFFRGADPPTARVIVVATFALGYCCAWLRQRSGSLRPAIAAHVAFNIGGLLAGIAIVIATKGAGLHRPPS
jgi:membrane protease YdiL (CAAX protease family)